jgi:glycosyltransferase involved in cell wall biosynthesis
MLSTPEGKEAFRRLTGLREAVFAGEAQQAETKLPIVAVLMPSYRLPAPQAWEGVNRMMRASSKVCTPYMEPTIRQSVVHWTRNYALSLLLKSMKPWDYVLFIDDDIVMPDDGLAKLLAHKVDLVAAACTVRVDPPMPNFRVYDPDTRLFMTCMDWNREGLVGGKYFGVGTGAALFSRKCLERVAEYYINCEYEKKYYALGGVALDKLQTGRQKKAKETSDFWWFEFLKQPDGQGEFGEDISFCFKCIELGIPVYVDTTVRPRHMGDYGYNLDDYLDCRASFHARKELEPVNELLGSPMQEVGA